MSPLTTPDQPSESHTWTLIGAMIAASPQQPWIWALLVSTGMVLSLWRRR
ncbi:hypothetical protein ABZ990_16280 [Streptomyces sp. NPDC046203]